MFKYEYQIVPLSFLSKNTVLSPISLQWHIFNKSRDHGNLLWNSLLSFFGPFACACIFTTNIFTIVF